MRKLFLSFLFGFDLTKRKRLALFSCFGFRSFTKWLMRDNFKDNDVFFTKNNLVSYIGEHYPFSQLTQYRRDTA